MQTTVTEKQKTPSAKFLEKREQILNRAAEKFNLLGVRGATLADIAVSVGLNLTSIRHYFLKKEDLVAAVFLRSIEVHAERLAKSKKIGPPEVRVRDMVRRYFEFRRRIREGTTPEVIIFGDLRSLTPAHAQEVWPKYVDLFRTFREIVADREEFEADSQRVNARTHMLVSQYMRSVFWLPNYSADDFERVEARFIDILINGLAAPGVPCRDYMVHLPEDPPPDKRSRDSFLLAATELINDQGYHGASVERIAARLNVTKGSFYHHIDAKDDLVVACFERSFALLRSAQGSAVAVERLGVDQAGAAVAALVRRQQTAAGPLLRNGALMSVDPVKRAAMLREMGRIVARFADMISDGMVDGSVRPCDARIAGEMMMAQINSASQLGNWAQNVTADNVGDLYVKPLFKGLFC